MEDDVVNTVVSVHNTCTEWWWIVREVEALKQFGIGTWVQEGRGGGAYSAAGWCEGCSF